LKRYVFYFIATAVATASLTACAHDQSDLQLANWNADSVGLSGERFLSALASTNPAERDKANLYLLGVLDVTEKKKWCDYKTYKTVTIRERVYETLKKLPPQRLKERASSLIEESLSSRYACKDAK
jgi:hypothetical protein